MDGEGAPEQAPQTPRGKKRKAAGTGTENEGELGSTPKTPGSRKRNPAGGTPKKGPARAKKARGGLTIDEQQRDETVPGSGEIGIEVKPEPLLAPSEFKVEADAAELKAEEGGAEDGEGLTLAQRLERRDILRAELRMLDS